MIGNRDRTVAIASSQPALLATLLGVVLLAASPRPVQACLVPASELTGRTFWPRAGEPLATNGQVTVRYDGHWALSESSALLSALGSELQLRPVGGQPVAVTTTVADGLLVVRPNSALAPNQAYELLDRRSIPCSLMTSACTTVGAPMVVASFTTGAAPDLTAPPFVGLAPPVVSVSPDVCNESGCCGPFRGYPVTLSWPATTDQGAPVLYRLYRRAGGEALDRIVTTDATSMSGFMSCIGGHGGPNRTVLTPGTYLVRAVDSAGNEDTNTIEQVLADRCTAVPDGGDGSVSDDADSPGVDTGSSDGRSPGITDEGDDVLRNNGCGCTATPHAQGARGLLGGAVALLVLAVLRRRRRLPRTTPSVN